MILANGQHEECSFVRGRRAAKHPEGRARFRRPSGVNEGGPYTPTIATLPHSRNRDFQNGTR
jgi:hypothetical protein